ncbi:hypothetical protein J517_4456, partial [Acinetobacter baumannii 118362]
MHRPFVTEPEYLPLLLRSSNLQIQNFLNYQG